MKAVEILKSFFKRLKKEGNEEQKLLTSSKNTQESNWREELVKKSQINEPLRFQRDDGSILSLVPRMQLNGEQECEFIRNEMSGNVVQIPVYTIINERNEQGAQILGHKILLDMNVEQLRNLQPDELSFLSNDLLSKERINKVVNEYEGYAGGLYRDNNTRYAYKG